MPPLYSLTLDPNVTAVSVFDLVGAPGVAADLGHIDMPTTVTGHGMTLKQFTGDDAIDNQGEFQANAFDEALQGCDVVVIPAGVPRKPGMTRQDLFEVNASLNKGFDRRMHKKDPSKAGAEQKVVAMEESMKQRLYKKN